MVDDDVLVFIDCDIFQVHGGCEGWNEPFPLPADVDLALVLTIYLEAAQIEPI